MSALERYLTEVWYGERRGWILLPVGWIYRLLMAMRRQLYARSILRVHAVDVPVLVVGNLTVGGTGKTPLVIYLVERALERGIDVAVVSRGYGRQSRGLVRVDAGTPATRSGDEARLIAQRCGVPVYVAERRIEAARAAVAGGAQLIISDDGLQHLALARQAEVVVIDAERGLGNGRCLPAGPLREPPARLSHVDAILLNGSEGEADVWMEAQDAVSPDGRRRALSEFAGQRVRAVAAIGHPKRFFRMLEGKGIEVDACPLTDHATLTDEHLRDAGGRPVLITEKDAVKCTPADDDNVWVVPVRAVIADASRTRLDALLTRLVS